MWDSSILIRATPRVLDHLRWGKQPPKPTSMHSQTDSNTSPPPEANNLLRESRHHAARARHYSGTVDTSLTQTEPSSRPHASKQAKTNSLTGSKNHTPNALQRIKTAETPYSMYTNSETCTYSHTTCYKKPNRPTYYLERGRK